MMKDEVVGVARQERQPGIHFGAVVRKAVVFARLDKAADEPVDIAILAAGRKMDRDGYALPDDVGKGYIRVRGQKVEMEGEETRDPFDACQLREQEEVLARRRLDGADLILLAA